MLRAAWQVLTRRLLQLRQAQWEHGVPGRPIVIAEKALVRLCLSADYFLGVAVPWIAQLLEIHNSTTLRACPSCVSVNRWPLPSGAPWSHLDPIPSGL